jgi:hypothetical protein
MRRIISLLAVMAVIAAMAAASAIPAFAAGPPPFAQGPPEGKGATIIECALAPGVAVITPSGQTRGACP